MDQRLHRRKAVEVLIKHRFNHKVEEGERSPVDRGESSLRSTLGLKKAFLFMAVMLLGICFHVSPASAKPYTQVIDNSDKDRFKVSKSWGNTDYSPDRYGNNYRFSKPAAKGAAMYKVNNPKKGNYVVCGRWPASDNYSRATPIKIRTVFGTKTRRVNQRRNSGEWVKVGTFRMEAGEGYKIRVSRDSGRKGFVVADAFKVIRTLNPDNATCTPSRNSKGEKVYKKARNYLGTRYVLGNPFECFPGSEMDCSCLTMAAYRDVGIDIPEDPEQQWKEGREVERPRTGDLLFYKEEGSERSISHVGIYAGDGKIIHASSYSGEVSIGQMRWPGDGYIGARRLV